MQFSSLEATTGFCSRSSFRYSGSPSQPKWRSALLLAQTGAAILGVLAFQQFLLQLYTACWQVALLFALIGLMVALLLGQFRYSRSSSQATTRWPVGFSFVITLLGLGVAVCILTANPPIA